MFPLVHIYSSLSKEFASTHFYSGFAHYACVYLLLPKYVHVLMHMC